MNPKTIFGTDGVRGLANSGYITPGNSIKLAIAATRHFNKTGEEFKIVIGKDTRLSGYMLETALTSGFIAAGADVNLLGPIPTPAVSVITRTLRANLGVVISASHNPYQDNGIKFFNSKGLKITPEDEAAITSLFFKDLELASPGKMGKAKRIDDVNGRYVEFVKGSLARHLTLSGLKIVVDTAHGAAYKVAPEVFWELGAEVITIGNSPDGLNINKDCGATSPKLLQQTVIETGVDIGFALDGDADRLIVVDEKGEVIDGDYIIASIATDWLNRKKLKNNKVVATTMSNMGLEKYLSSIGLELVRCDVGDKYVVEKMIEVGSNLGGEKSGHIIPFNFATTGDGLISALQVLNFLVENNKKPSDIRKLYSPLPQAFSSLRKEVDLGAENIKHTISKIEKDILHKKGRVVVRQSGTENLIRIMVEAEEEGNLKKAIQAIKGAI